MRKLIILIALLVPFIASAQSTELVTTGVTHNIADAYLSAADSIHTLGIVSMRDGLEWVDSLTIDCIAEDSLNIRFFLIPHDGFKAAAIADSGAGVGFNANVGTGGSGLLSRMYVPWHNIVAAIKPADKASNYRLYARVYSVGSEVASSNKKFRVIVHRYW